MSRVPVVVSLGKVIDFKFHAASGAVFKLVS